MRAILLAAVLASLASCGRPEPRAAPPPVVAAPVPVVTIDAAPTATTCVPLPFADSIPLAEASGAVFLDTVAGRALLVVSDSGNDGAYALLDPGTGAVREQGVLPLAGRTDDVEGLTREGAGDATRIIGLASNGTIYRWARGASGFTLDGDPTLISDRDEFTCPKRRGNCAKNFEGICLAPVAPASGCVGFAASKEDGRLWCLVRRGDRLTIDPAVSIAITSGDAIADCAFTPDGRAVLVGANAFGADQVWRVDGWQTPTTATISDVGMLGPGFAEVLAVDRGGLIYRMSDLGGAPSLTGKYRCEGLGE
ncbi:MAG: hypothetical protein K8W52_02705 [Deltaproteobacteria bacterium]|nr:hypothetical protein [Deltaproteobacteria bacterium]